MKNDLHDHARALSVGDHHNAWRLVPADRRQTLLARRLGDNRYGFDLVIQGPRETVFFDA
jgi:protocatechuate 3,4-dioxygenase alpha subunit